jgi:hypothetical protein
MNYDTKIKVLRERLWDAKAAQEAAHGMPSNVYWAAELARLNRELKTLQDKRNG